MYQYKTCDSHQREYHTVMEINLSYFIYKSLHFKKASIIERESMILFTWSFKDATKQLIVCVSVYVEIYR